MASSNECIRILAALALATGMCACEKSSREALSDARNALAEGSFSEAVAAAGTGLAGSPDEVTSWGLELVILEAHARAGSGAEAVGQIAKLAKAHPERISATDYSSTAQLLRTADQKPAAIEVLDLGVKRFPDDAILARMIEESVATGEDPAELEMLKSLGYIE